MKLKLFLVEKKLISCTSQPCSSAVQ